MVTSLVPVSLDQRVSVAQDPFCNIVPYAAIELRGSTTVLLRATDAKASFDDPSGRITYTRAGITPLPQALDKFLCFTEKLFKEKIILFFFVPQDSIEAV